MRFVDGPVKWGIIGCGDVCEVKSGPAFSKVKDSSLVAVMRRDVAKAADYAKRHKVDVFYGSADQLINDPDVNAVYIATPPGSHEDYAIAAMSAGKPVYIEKPVTLNSASCQRMIDASNKYQTPAAVAHYRRELALFRRVKDIIERGTIGKVRLVVLNLYHPSKTVGPAENWRVDPSISGGGLFFDLAPHQLDIIYWIFGKPVYVRGHSVNQGKYYDAPDVTSLTIEFENDVLFHGLWSFNVQTAHKQDTCRIIGSSGSLEFPFFASFTKASLEIEQNGTLRSDEFIFPEYIQEPMIEKVTKYIQGHGSNPCSLDEALITMKMMEKAYAH